MNKLNIKHIVFDWSGTLFDDHRVSYLATQETIRHFTGITLTQEEYRQNFTIPVENFYRLYDSKTPWQVIDRHYFEVFENYFYKGKLFDGTLKLLRELKRQKITVSLLSTVRQDLLERVCCKLKIDKYFIFIQGGASDKRSALAAHLKRLQIKPEMAVFIGDTVHEIEAAHAAGVMSGCVLNGYHGTSQLVSRKPRFVWNCQADIHAFIKSLSGSLPQKKPGKRPLATVGALVFNDKAQIFLILTHKWSYTYGIPGGKVDKGETCKSAVMRELHEETGMRIEPGEVFMLQDCIDSPEFYVPDSHFILLNYLATTRSERYHLNKEAQSGLWIEPELALHLKLNAPTRLLIEKYLR